MRREAAEQTKANVRAATRMLIMVVTTYLMANILNVIITAWEVSRSINRPINRSINEFINRSI